MSIGDEEGLPGSAGTKLGFQRRPGIDHRNALGLAGPLDRRRQFRGVRICH